MRTISDNFEFTNTITRREDGGWHVLWRVRVSAPWEVGTLAGVGPLSALKKAFGLSPSTVVTRWTRLEFHLVTDGKIVGVIHYAEDPPVTDSRESVEIWASRHRSIWSVEGDATHHVARPGLEGFARTLVEWLACGWKAPLEETWRFARSLNLEEGDSLEVDPKVFISEFGSDDFLKRFSKKATPEHVDK